MHRKISDCECAFVLWGEAKKRQLVSQWHPVKADNGLINAVPVNTYL
jgi:hypothetical protein